MTKQQLREAIRRVIKQELLNEALYLPPMQVAYFEGYDDAKKGKPADVNYFRKHMELDEALYLPPMQVAYFEGYDDAKKGKPADVNYFRKHMELDEEKTVANPNAGKWRIVGIESGAPLTKEFYKSKEDAQAAAKELGKIKSSGIKYVQLKDTMKVHEAAPAPSKPSTSPGTKERPATPDKKEPRRPLGNPNVRPAPKAKATMKEAEMLKQVIKRFKSKKNA